MGTQLIFVMECDRKSKTDWMYISSTIHYFYRIDFHTKLTPIYLGGRNNYTDKNVQAEIRRLRKQFSSTSKTNRTYVLYCFDCDDYDCNPNDRDFLNNAKRFCDQAEAEFIWFCKDIERVYLGKQTEDSKKTAEAIRFKENANRGKVTIDSTTLMHKTYRKNASNLLNILDKYLNRSQ